MQASGTGRAVSLQVPRSRSRSSGVTRSISARGRSGASQTPAITALSWAVRASTVLSPSRRQSEPSTASAMRIRPAGGSTPTPTDTVAAREPARRPASCSAGSRAQRSAAWGPRRWSSSRAAVTAATAAANGAARSSVTRSGRAAGKAPWVPSTREDSRSSPYAMSNDDVPDRRAVRMAIAATSASTRPVRREALEEGRLERAPGERRGSVTRRRREIEVREREARERRSPGRLGSRRPGRELGQPRGHRRGEGRQRLPGDEPVPSRGLGDRDRGTVGLAELAQQDVRRASGDLQAVRQDGRHRSRREARGPVGHIGAADEDEAVSQEDLRQRERVRVRPEVEGAHEGGDLVGRRLPVDHRGRRRPIVPAEVAPPGEVLLATAGVSRGDAARQVREGVERGRVALRVEREGRLVGSHVEDALLQEPSRVGPRRHLVPRDAVRRLAAEDRPARDVEPRVAGQGPVVEVDGEAAHQAQRLGRDHREVRDAREVVEVEAPQDGGESRSERWVGIPFSEAQRSIAGSRVTTAATRWPSPRRMSPQPARSVPSPTRTHEWTANGLTSCPRL